MWKISTSERSTMQSNKSSLQKLWNERTLQEGVYEEVNPLGRSSKQFQWFWFRLLQWIWWTCLCSDTSSSCKGDTQEETSHPVSNKCQLIESEEAGRRPLSYCSAEGRHRSGCQSSQLNYIWQNNMRQIKPTAINLQNGSIWKFHCGCTWEVLHIPQMERQDLQAIILHDNSQYIAQHTFQRWLLHPRIAETMLLGGNFENLEMFQYTAYNWLGVIPDAWQIISTLVRWRNWTGEAI